MTTTLREVKRTVLDFRGRFGPGIDRWAYRPVDVPPGVRRITVRTWHERFSLLGVARNVLDLGIFGPDGFRGWSGGARDRFTLAAGDATPGYLPGPITPGRWSLAFGPVVLNPLGMRWRARVTLEHGEDEPVALALGPGDRTGDQRTGWFRGDLHLHTVHSDGVREPGELAAEARAAGLDFIASTEHNTSAAHAAWRRQPTAGLLVIPGEEVTTRHGHWLALGTSDWVDWRYGPRDGRFPQYAAQVRRAGGLVVAAHPAVPMPGCAWEFGFAAVDAIEVWNGAWNVDDEIALRIWHRQLRRGRRIVAVGGSDSHAPHQPVGRPQTAVHADGLTPEALIAGLKRGRAYIAESSAITLELGADGGTAEATVTGAPNTTLSLITENGRIAKGEGHVEADTRGHRFIRAEVRQRYTRRMVALSNPIWLTPPEHGADDGVERD
ncbi:CehA/McbA family metallohydrolase [Dactylosporangium sp. NPDC051541]|uniref:CehA/McbA family metallohydrolase n=1 Tax=Dactylosporangium sp. NPDC051541 TaxID=3363977 RepID=UPI0037AF02E8